MKKHLYIFLIFLCSASNTWAQDQTASSLYTLFSPIVNPATMSNYDRFVTAGMFNYQMLNYKGGPVHFNVLAQAPIGKSNFYLGGGITHDRIGVRYKTDFDVSAAYRIKLYRNHYLSFGITGRVRLTEAQFNTLPDIDPNDPIFTSQTRQLLTPDFRLGVNYVSEYFFLGASVGNIFTPKFSSGGASNISSRIEDIHFYLQTGFIWVINKQWKLKPSILWRQIYGSPTQIDMNATFEYKDRFGFGLAYRTTESVIFRLHVLIADQFRIGYAFNMGTGFRNNIENFGNEIMLIYNVKKPQNTPMFKKSNTQCY
jgi:type IX secretion system PorP/SprF family membrane protein